MKADVDSLDALVDRSLQLDAEGREAEADQELRQQSADVESAARVLRGRHYRAVGDAELALHEYERGVALGDQTALRYLAGTLSHLGRHARAEQLYRHAPLGKDDQLELDYADYLWDQGRLDEAEARLRELVQHGNAAAERVLADLISARWPDSEEAAAHYLAAILLGDALAVTNLGVEWLEQGRMLEAEFALRRASAEGDELAAKSLERLFNETGSKPLTFDVPHQWRTATDELRTTRHGEQPPDWVACLYAAQLVHLRSRAASANEIAAFLRRSRWSGA
jgi:tetratricopeptide (TPR) repeat protein